MPCATACSHKSQQIHQIPGPWPQVNASQEEDPLTMGEERLQGSAKLRLSFQAGTICHCQALPAGHTWGKAGPGAAHGPELQPSPGSTEAESGATHTALPQEIPTGRIKEVKDVSAQFSPYCSLCGCSMVHLLCEITSYILNLFPCFLSVPSALGFVLSIVDDLTFYGPIHSKKRNLNFL